MKRMENEPKPIPSILRFLPLRLKHGLRDSRIAHDAMDMLSTCLALPRLVSYFVPFADVRTETYASPGKCCDVYPSATRNSPVVIFVHGGAWGT